MTGRYLIALGGNLRHHRHGRPERVLEAALTALQAIPGCTVLARSPILATTPLGPSRRRYANAAAVVTSELEPDRLLPHLQRVERRFGRRPRGRRWAARVLDLDIVLWSGGPWSSAGIVVPHTEFRDREFVLRPAAHIARRWRDPLTGRSIGHLLARLTRPRPALR